MGRLLRFVCFIAATGLAVALYFAARPQDLSDVAGREPAAQARDLTQVLKSAASRNLPVTLTEKELNAWLARRLAGRQEGPAAEKVAFQRVNVRLSEGLGEVIMTREVFGKPFTVSVFLTMERQENQDGPQNLAGLHGGKFHESIDRPLRGGRFGRLVVPQGFLLLVLPAYKHLAAALQEEIAFAFDDMARISIRENRLELEPQRPETGIR